MNNNPIIRILSCQNIVGRELGLNLRSYMKYVLNCWRHSWRVKFNQELLIKINCIDVFIFYINLIKIYLKCTSQTILKIGMGFLMASFGMFTLGIIFLFDRALIVMGNMAFMVGLVMLIGAKSTLGFFIKKGKLKGSLIFLLGFMIIVFLRWTPVGFSVQLYGLFLLFKSFLPFVYDSATKMPVIGRYLRNPQIKHVVDNISQKNKGPDV